MKQITLGIRQITPDLLLSTLGMKQITRDLLSCNPTIESTSHGCAFGYNHGL